MKQQGASPCGPGAAMENQMVFNTCVPWAVTGVCLSFCFYFEVWVSPCHKIKIYLSSSSSRGVTEGQHYPRNPDQVPSL